MTMMMLCCARGLLISTAKLGTIFINNVHIEHTPLALAQPGAGHNVAVTCTEQVAGAQARARTRSQQARTHCVCLCFWVCKCYCSALRFTPLLPPVLQDASLSDSEESASTLFLRRRVCWEREGEGRRLPN